MVLARKIEMKPYAIVTTLLTVLAFAGLFSLRFPGLHGPAPLSRTVGFCV